MERTWHPTKAAWAAAQAADARQRADALPTVESANWRGIRARVATVQRLHAEARKFDRLAERFAAQGI